MDSRSVEFSAYSGRATTDATAGGRVIHPDAKSTASFPKSTAGASEGDDVADQLPVLVAYHRNVASAQSTSSCLLSIAVGLENYSE